MSQNSNSDKNQRKQRQSLDRSVKALKKEQRIFDEGYGAVRKMAAKMVQNGATPADIIFHANQIWHEFKVGALTAGSFRKDFRTCGEALPGEIRPKDAPR